jgi:hypothetical protein
MVILRSSLTSSSPYRLRDAIEPLRASINARVFAFVASHEFALSDFPASGVSTHRIAQPIIAELLARCLSPDQDILDRAAWMRNLVMRYGAPSRRKGRRDEQNLTVI